MATNNLNSEMQKSFSVKKKDIYKIIRERLVLSDTQYRIKQDIALKYDISESHIYSIIKEIYAEKVDKKVQEDIIKKFIECYKNNEDEFILTENLAVLYDIPLRIVTKIRKEALHKFCVMNNIKEELYYSTKKIYARIKYLIYSDRIDDLISCLIRDFNLEYKDARLYIKMWKLIRDYRKFFTPDSVQDYLFDDENKKEYFPFDFSLENISVSTPPPSIPMFFNM